jgi:hypothetical protein
VKDHVLAKILTVALYCHPMLCSHDISKYTSLYNSSEKSEATNEYEVGKLEVQGLRHNEKDK